MWHLDIGQKCDPRISQMLSIYICQLSMCLIITGNSRSARICVAEVNELGICNAVYEGTAV